MIIVTSSFSKSSVSKMFSFQSKVGVFKFFWFDERFRKLRFRDGLVWTVGLNVAIKLRSQIPPTYYERCVKSKAGVFFISSVLKSVFEKLCHVRFGDGRISVNDGPNITAEMKMSFSNFCGLVFTSPELLESRQHSALFEKPNNVTVRKIIIFKTCFLFDSLVLL